MSLLLVLLAALLAGTSGLPGLFVPRSGRRLAGPLAAVLHGVASLLGLAGALLAFAPGGGASLHLAWSLPGAELSVAVDGLSAIFLVPLFLVSGAGAIYGEGYAPERTHPRGARSLRFFYGLLTAGIAIVLVARNAVLFLAAWEVMALAGYFLVTVERKRDAARAAGWIYLVATHFSSLLLFALFVLLPMQGGGGLSPIKAGVAASAGGTAVFFLALCGFGIKAGIVPLHVWLPEAHAAAPSHVSAVMSGVLIKAGVYGLFRVLTLYPDPPAWWGGAILAAGAASGLFGVALALAQHDLKRLLAYHSIENVGIILMGLGLALLGTALGHPAWVLLGLAGGLLHVVNHGLFKSLLFFGAGSAVRAAGTRDMDRMGGLLPLKPATGLLFLTGAVAICGLPPLNGFISEWILYLGLFGTLRDGSRGAWIGGALAAPALAMIGALAVLCFVKAFGTVFLGQRRSTRSVPAGESPLLIAPMVVLAALCAAIGLFPAALAPALERAAAACVTWPLPPLSSEAPLRAVSLLAILLTALLATGAAAQAVWIRRRPAAAAPTWDCGFAAPTARMQYTSSSFAQWAAGFFRFATGATSREPRITGPFPAPSRLEVVARDPVLDGLVRPAAGLAGRLAGRARALQQGRVQLYVLYIAAALIVLLLIR